MGERFFLISPWQEAGNNSRKLFRNGATTKKSLPKIIYSGGVR
jgi:hypothetical protein